MIRKICVVATVVWMFCALPFISESPRAQSINDLEKEFQRVLQDLAERVREAGDRWGRSLKLEQPSGDLPLAVILDHKDALELSPQQVDDLKKLRSRFDREAIRSEADIKVAKMELDELLEADTVNLEKAEMKVRELERLRGDRKLSRIRTAEAAKALLRPEQLKKLAVLTGGRSVN